MQQQTTMDANVRPVIGMVPAGPLKETLDQSFADARQSVEKIERFFQLIPSRQWSDEFLATFFRSWKATHLKMLAIYGLTCRLQRMGNEAGGEAREKLMTAGSLNAETSYEDLGLDFDGQTHAELYDAFAGSFVPETDWQLDRYLIPEAQEFQRWIYRNMVVEDVAVGLLTNMFSEIYNHGEYSLALPAFTAYIDSHYNFTEEKKELALTYVNAHIEDETEIGHFLVVVDALEKYSTAMSAPVDYSTAGRVFTEYLARLGVVMEALTERMLAEIEHDGKTVPAAAQVGEMGLN